jgi:hypothetical protein
MKYVKLITVFCILSGLIISADAGQNRKQKPNKRRPPKVARKIILGPPILLEADSVPPEKPYLTKAEAACPRFCALLTTLSGIGIEPKAGVYELTNQQQFQIKILLKAARVEDQEYLSMASDAGARNPAGPTVELTVKKIENGRMVDIPVRVSSSGGGRDVTVLSLWLSLKIPYPDEVRKKRARSWAEDMIRFIEEGSAREGKPTPQWLADRETLANYLSQVAVDNESGEYELRFRYESKGKDVRNKALETDPLRIRIVDGGNPFAHFLSKDSDNESKTPKGFYRTMDIDPQSLLVTFSDLLPNHCETCGPFYWPFTGQTGDYSVDHYDGKQPYPHRVRYNAFAVSAENRLGSRTKYQELLHGLFGTVYAQTQFLYGSTSGYRGIKFYAYLYANEAEHEPPQIIAELPGTHLELSAITLVRVFRSPPEYIVLIAQYAPDGYLEFLSVDGAKDGNWVHRSELQSLDESLGLGTGDQTKNRIRFGFPERFPVADYLKKAQPVWKVAAVPSTLDVVNLHYERNRWVRQDSFSRRGKETRFLTYAVTPQDLMLEPIDKIMPFGPFISSRK